jgi:hypothetical protein
MKNIHILPTEKPSYLYKMSDNKLRLSDLLEKGSSAWINQHIYITSDEEIKVGDWMYYKHFGEDIVCKYDTMNGQNTNVNEHKPFYQKIILTTDQDLIKDGVQAIDDTFLEWFVKNSSCEFVEIVKEKIILGEVAGTTYTDFNYRIIIPREKSKQETILEQIDQNNPVTRGSTALVYKQETLEEAAERLYPFALDGIGNIEVDKKNHFIKGAEYQATQMYSEEEVLTILKSHKEFIVKELKGLSSFKNEKVWFEQHKKK